MTQSTERPWWQDGWTDEEIAAEADFERRIRDEELEQYVPDRNEHGVEGEKDGDTFIPMVCLGCDHYSGPEYGDYGKQYGWPYCMLGLFFPTRKGTCKKSVPAGTANAAFKARMDAERAERAKHDPRPF